MRIVIGGVPFGCGNIGDEAILASVIRIFRKMFLIQKLLFAPGPRKQLPQNSEYPLFLFMVLIPSIQLTTLWKSSTIATSLSGRAKPGSLIIL